MSPPFNVHSQPVWSHDGKSLYFSAMDDRLRMHVYRVDSRGGTPTTVFSLEEGWMTGFVNNLAVSPDGRTIYYLRMNKGVTSGVTSVQIVARDLNSADERVLPRGGFEGVPMMSLSPDGNHLAFYGSPPTGVGGEILLLPAQGGAPRELAKSRQSPSSLLSPRGTARGASSISSARGPAVRGRSLTSGRRTLTLESCGKLMLTQDISRH